MSKFCDEYEFEEFLKNAEADISSHELALAYMKQFLPSATAKYYPVLCIALIQYLAESEGRTTSNSATDIEALKALKECGRTESQHTAWILAYY